MLMTMSWTNQIRPFYTIRINAANELCFFFFLELVINSLGCCGQSWPVLRTENWREMLKRTPCPPMGCKREQRPTLFPPSPVNRSTRPLILPVRQIQLLSEQRRDRTDCVWLGSIWNSQAPCSTRASKYTIPKNNHRVMQIKKKCASSMSHIN